METNPQPASVSFHRSSSKKKVMWAAIAGVIILAVITAIVAMKMNKEATAVAPDANISISANGINPATINVKAGQSVTLTNTDDAAHALTADQKALPGFETPEPLSTGDTYTYIFEDKGTFRFYDPAAPQGFNATVIVE